MEVLAITSREQRGTVRGENRCCERVGEGEGCNGDRVGDPSPPASALESEDEEERDDDDAQNAECRGTRLPRSLDHAGVGGHRDACDHSFQPTEQHRSEHDQQAARQRDCDCRGRPDRAFVVPHGRHELQQQQVSRLPWIVVDDPRQHRAEGSPSLRERRGLVGAHGAVPERHGAERERAERDRHGCEGPRDSVRA